VETITIVLQVLLGLAFLGAGGSKLAGVQQQVDDLARYRYPRWFMLVTGTVEVIGAFGMLVGIFVPTLAVLAGLLLAATMVGAFLTHIRIKDPVGRMVPPIVLFTLSVVVLVALI